MRTKGIILSFVVFIACSLFASSVYAYAQPVLPHAFYGAVAINGSPAPIGTQVEARGEGVLTGVSGNPVITTEVGRFGSADTGGVKLTVQGEIAEGTILTFYVNGVSTDETYPWHSQEITEIDLTAAIETPSQSGAGGGGGIGGGGGGGGGGGLEGVTSILDSITWSGRFIVDVTATSADGKVALSISKDTVAKNRVGQLLSYIKIPKCQDTPAPPTGYNAVGMFYELSPDGASFDPPITVTFRYDPNDIPEGIPEENLSLAYYDKNASKWVFLVSKVKPINNTITASINHFTCFAIFAKGVEVPAPAPVVSLPPTPPSSAPSTSPLPAPIPPAPSAFKISSMSISSDEVNIGEVITVSMIVANTGGVPGTYKVALKINGVVEETRDVSVAAGASQKVSFTVAKNTAGKYSVDCNGLTSSFTVKEKVITPLVETSPGSGPTISSTFNWSFIGGVMALIALGGLIVYFMIVRRPRWGV